MKIYSIEFSLQVDQICGSLARKFSLSLLFTHTYTHNPPTKNENFYYRLHDTW